MEEFVYFENDGMELSGMMTGKKTNAALIAAVYYAVATALVAFCYCSTRKRYLLLLTTTVRVRVYACTHIGNRCRSDAENAHGSRSVAALLVTHLWLM